MVSKNEIKKKKNSDLRGMFLLKEPPKGLPQKIQIPYEEEKMNQMLRREGNTNLSVIINVKCN
jgi:hypothetical protein